MIKISQKSNYISYVFSSYPGDKCPSHTFTCANDQCIAMENICDGIPDCDDYSDETSICIGMYNNF